MFFQNKNKKVKNFVILQITIINCNFNKKNVIVV